LLLHDSPGKEFIWSRKAEILKENFIWGVKPSSQSAVHKHLVAILIYSEAKKVISLKEVGAF
jgi:hypothetical protein